MPIPNPTNKIGIVTPYDTDIHLVRWSDVTVQNYAAINPTFNYFFVEE